MNAAQKEFITALWALPDIDEDPDLWRTVYDLTSRLPHDDNSAVFPAVFEFFEQHPHAEHGTPGPLVHLLERAFSGGYEALLLTSLRRRPVPHTLWLANRLLNSPAIAPQLREELVDALRASLTHAAIDAATRDQAAAFLRHQGLLTEDSSAHS